MTWRRGLCWTWQCRSMGVWWRPIEADWEYAAQSDSRLGGKQQSKRGGNDVLEGAKERIAGQSGERNSYIRVSRQFHVQGFSQWTLGLDQVCSFVETGPGEHLAWRQALAWHGASEPGRCGEQVGGGTGWDPCGGRTAAAGACTVAGPQEPATERRSILSRPARQGGEQVRIGFPFIMYF